MSHLLSLLCVHIFFELHKAPILNHAFNIGNNTKIGWLYRREDPLELAQVSEVGRQVVHVQGLGMKVGKRNVRGVEPITVQFVNVVQVLPVGHGAAVEQVPGLGRGLRRHVFDEAVALGFPGPLGDHEEGLSDFAVGRCQIEKLLVGVRHGELGHAQPAVGVAHADGHLLVANEDILPGLGPVVEQLWKVQRELGAGLESAVVPLDCDADDAEVGKCLTNVLENKAYHDREVACSARIFVM